MQWLIENAGRCRFAESSPIIEAVIDGEQAIYDVAPCIGLRAELACRGLAYAAKYGLPYERTDGEIPGIVFGRSEDGRHGNFHPLAYKRILKNPEWAKRLAKAHSASRRMRLRSNWQWKELDCANSSDALLMNVFCHPGVRKRPAFRSVLGIDANAVPEFGFKPRIPLLGGRRDCTEIDMKLGHLLVEAKLTESNFKSVKIDLLARYCDLQTVFHPLELPSRYGKQESYQIIRGTLAAHSTGLAFCVLCDSRRPELIELWHRIMRSVRPFELKTRLMLLTWQELAPTLPKNLQRFLAQKYGIFSPIPC